MRKIFLPLVAAALTAACSTPTPTPPAPPPPPPSPPPGTPANAVYAALDQTTNGLKTDIVTWYDKSGQARTAALVRTPQAGSKGGFLEQATYKLAGGATRTVNASADARGFGYIVSHLEDPGRAGGNDDSPLGSELNNASSLVWQGTHHLIYQYTLNYPRWGVRGGANKQFDMPVTVRWLFSTGRNQPLWTVTMDLSAANDGEVVADSRAPYGDMDFSGSSGDAIGGVMWGDTHHFASAGGPLTLNSGWDWSQVNSGAAYNALYTQGADAEMGIVGTRVISKQDAGGYQGADGLRGATSATKSCAQAGDVHTMPCLYQWSFQSVNYSFGGVNEATSSKRLAWGADWGYLGQSVYTPINNKYANTAGSFPKRSYSTFIVLDAHAGNPTKSLSAQMKVIDDTTLSATGASVATSGIAGVGRTDTVNYSPVGYDHVYGTWEASLNAGGSATLNFNVPAGKTLERPVMVLRGYSSANAPSSVKLNGAALTADSGYFASVRSGSNELWLTLGSDLPGGLSSLQIAP